MSADERVIYRENLYEELEENLPEQLVLAQRRRFQTPNHTETMINSEFQRLAKQVKRANQERVKGFARREEISNEEYSDQPRPILPVYPNYVYATSWPQWVRLITGSQQVLEKDLIQWHVAEEPSSIKSWHIGIQSFSGTIFERVPNLISLLKGPQQIPRPQVNELGIKWFHGAGRVFAALIDKQPRSFRPSDVDSDIEVYICYARSQAKLDYWDSISDLFDEIIRLHTYLQARDSEEDKLLPLTATLAEFDLGTDSLITLEMSNEDEAEQRSNIRLQEFWELDQDEKISPTVDDENPKLREQPDREPNKNDLT